MVSKRSSTANSHPANHEPKSDPVPPSKRRRTQDTSDEASLIQKLKSNAQAKQLESTSRRPEKRNGKSVDRSKVDDSRTVVTTGADVDRRPKQNGTSDVVEISSGESEDEETENSSDGSVDSNEDVENEVPHNEGAADQEMEDVNTGEQILEDEAEEGDGALAEPSFGELSRANHPEPIDVEAALADPTAPSNALVQSTGSRALQPPSAASLGTVLSQALKTNDVDLLESCLHMTDIETIRTTIQRLPSSLASILLQKLAERLHRRPGRAGNLMIWVQWTLVAHGGYLASQPELMNRLRTLHRVIRERASGLQSLLSLKGKLDMLEAQMQLRKSMQTTVDAGNSDEDDEAVIYVEGRDDEQSEEDGERQSTSAAKRGRASRDLKQKYKDLPDVDMAMADTPLSEDDESDEMPTTVNGLGEFSGSEEESDENLLDTEAEETDADTDDEIDEDDVDHDDLDSADED
ncbi:MAG: hypothetical protein M4579_007260 [Chaenotheca gracillima]|nr:MAG: hypothetical protein M4579_007260 [Chaenotheca gracillima]